MTKKQVPAKADPKKNLPATTNQKPRGRGMEEADAETFAIPFLAMLQKGTPQADPDDPAYIKGAKAGMFMNTVTQELFEEVTIIPCYFQRRFNRWAPRDSGGGFKGQFMPSQVKTMETDGTLAQNEEGRWFFALPDGTVNEKKCDILTDTRMHFCLLEGSDGTLAPVLVSLSRTQLKKSRNWASLIDQRGGDSWTTAYTAKSKLEENDKGKWMGWVIAVERETTAEEQARAEKFYEQVAADKVKVTPPVEE